TLRVHLQPRQGSILRLHLPQILLLLASLASAARQPPLSQDPPDRVLPSLESKRLLQPPRPEATDRLPGLHDSLLLGPRRLVRDPLRRSAQLHHGPGSSALVPPPPQPHRIAAAPERPRRLSIPMLLGIAHQIQAQLEATPFHLPPQHGTISRRVHEASAVVLGQRPPPSCSSGRSRGPASLTLPLVLRQHLHETPPHTPAALSRSITPPVKQLFPDSPELL